MVLHPDEWESVETDINFDELTPYKTASSLHVDVETYLVDDIHYRLIFAVGYDTEPMIEKLVI